MSIVEYSSIMWSLADSKSFNNLELLILPVIFKVTVSSVLLQHC
jgi:hypothetical protein